ncbi:hypothetical protein CVT24_006490 [Panaeolus cyanescens]|uniref:Uncharacterized protein n=1 Tax=Panaeolus cyanescens TaxID=181874 RepID=A0A409WSV2_9AGAR|nr:hypothetical protein CVT24_006490 [Panaeolus cyanescens]
MHSVNTSLEEETSHLSNGFSVVRPGVHDSTPMLAGTGEETVEPPHSVDHMVAFVDDAAYRFQQGQCVGRMIPISTGKVCIPRIGHHRISSHSTEAQEDQDDMDMTDIVPVVFDIPAVDFSPHVPLTAYGIDYSALALKSLKSNCCLTSPSTTSALKLTVSRKQ